MSFPPDTKYNIIQTNPDTTTQLVDLSNLFNRDNHYYIFFIII